MSTVWRRLLAVVLPVVAAIVLLQVVLEVFFGAGRLVIVDGVPEALDAGPLAWAKLTATALLWLIGLAGGAYAVARGAGPPEALRHGLTHLPAFALGLAAAGGCALLAPAVAPGPRTALVLLAAVLVAAVRVLLDGIAWSVGGDKPTWSQTGWFLLGGVALPLLLAYGLTRSGAAGVRSAEAVLMIVVLAVQASLAAYPHRTHDAAETTARVWPAAATVVAAVLISAGVAIANPYAAPEVATNDRGPAGPMVVGWPAGQHPVIVTNGGVWFCDDELCESFTDVHGGPPVIEGYSSATVGADGTVVRTAVTGGPETGGPFVHFGRCVRDGCRETWLPIRAAATEKLAQEGRTEAAGAAAPDGALWFFVALPVGRTYQYSLIRCADVACAAPQRHRVGVADRIPRDGYRDGSRARLSIGADGRPDASFWIGHSVYRYSCEPVTCANPRHTAEDADPPDAVWDAAGHRTVSVHGGELHDGDDAVPIPGDAPALAVAGPDVYVAAAAPSAPGAGFRVGSPTTWWRQTVWRCRGRDCRSTPLDRYEGEARSPMLAVAGDGRVLVVRSERIVLLRR